MTIIIAICINPPIFLFEHVKGGMVSKQIGSTARVKFRDKRCLPKHKSECVTVFLYEIFLPKLNQSVVLYSVDVCTYIDTCPWYGP